MSRIESCRAAPCAPRDEGAGVELSGWVNRRRDHGGLIFVDLRDHSGVTQIVFDPQHAQLCRSGASA